MPEDGITYVKQNAAIGISVKRNEDKVLVKVIDVTKPTEPYDVATANYTPEHAVSIAKRLIMAAASIDPKLGGVYYFYGKD